MRYLGLDVGSRRIGISVGEQIAGELATIIAPKTTTFYEPTGIKIAFKEILPFIKEENVGALVVGLPVAEDGSPTAESKKIATFCEALKSLLKLPFYFTNETLTSFMAADMLEEQGLNAKEIAEREHQLAAQLILQQYLEEHADI
jgi:putative Holliday junction resolvase